MDELEVADGQVLYEQLSGTWSDVIKMDALMTSQLRSLFRKRDFDSFWAEADILTAPNLGEVLASPTPPPFEYFVELPCVLDMEKKELRGFNIVYGLPLVKPGRKPRLGIGSMADQKQGAAPRTRDYKDEVIWKLSKYTKESIALGYKIANVGAFMAIRRPPPEDSPAYRGLTLQFEAGMTWRFWSVRQAKGKMIADHYMGHACTWSDEDIEWDGVNTHSPVAEHVVSIEMSTEELLQHLAEKKEKKRLASQAWNHSEKGKATKRRYIENPKNSGVMKASMAAWREKNAEKIKADKKAYRQTEKGKASVRAYNQTESAKASQQAYRQTEKGKSRVRAHKQSEKGKATARAYEQTEKVKASRLARRQKPEYKEKANARRRANRAKKRAEKEAAQMEVDEE